MQTFNEHSKPAKCPWAEHEWTIVQHSAHRAKIIMGCTKCETRMPLWKIEQQNTMQAQRKLINTIRKRALPEMKTFSEHSKKPKP
jgi:hypothetical protein